MTCVRYAPSSTPCLVAHAMTSASEMKISGLLHALANASSAVTQSPWTSLPHIEIVCGLVKKFTGAATGGTYGTAAASSLRGDGIAPRFSDITVMSESLLVV